MSRKTKKPKFPDSYLGVKAEEYDQSRWMERNQKRTTLSCIQYFYDEHLDDLNTSNFLKDNEYLVLDLGCGTGFSSEILSANGFRVVGVDILKDMIYKTRVKKKIDKDFQKIEFAVADINFLPFRIDSIDHIFSISAYNFIIKDMVNPKEKVILLAKTAKKINEILKTKGRIIIEFYPNDEKELNLFKTSFTNNDFKGFMIKQNPNQKSGQTFLLLKKFDN
jgi:SAM-dependent methyltransferase